MRPQKGILFPDADTICRRANVNFLPLRSMWSSVEGELGRGFRRWALVWSFVAALCVVQVTGIGTSGQQSHGSTGDRDQEAIPFHAVLFTCIYGRPHMTIFVLSYYASLRESLLAQENIKLDIFITGSDPLTTAPLAALVNAGYSDHPNSPLGSKHNFGLASLRMWYRPKQNQTREPEPAYPDAVVLIGSDDLLNREYFVMARNRMTRRTSSIPSEPLDVLGLRDLHVYELSSGRLLYTKGYRKFASSLDATIGCGRAFRWTFLERMNWTLWDGNRERSLDQSTVRLVREELRAALHNSVEAVVGLPEGVVAVDVKSGDLAGGRNIWSFGELVGAVGHRGRLHRFRQESAVEVFDRYFQPGFARTQLTALYDAMKSEGSNGSAFRLSKYRQCATH
jgi:hypothetical protein